MVCQLDPLGGLGLLGRSSAGTRARALEPHFSGARTQAPRKRTLKEENNEMKQTTLRYGVSRRDKLCP